MVNEEQLEMDELNQHECMLPLMKLLDHMEHNKINPPTSTVRAHALALSCAAPYTLSLCQLERHLISVKMC